MSTSRDIVVHELYGGNAATYSPEDVSVLLATTYGIEVKDGEDPDDVFVREIYNIDRRMATPPSPEPPPPPPLEVTTRAEEPSVVVEVTPARAYEPPSDDDRLWRFRQAPSTTELPRPVLGALSLDHLNTHDLPGPEFLEICHTPEDMLLVLCQIAETVVGECPHPPPHPTLKPLGWYLNSVQSDVHRDHADALRKEQQEKEAREDVSEIIARWHELHRTAK